MGDVDAFVAMGSNLGDRRDRIDAGVKAMAELPDTSLVAVSTIHETAPVGGPEQGAYLNGVAHLRTQLDAKRLLEHLLQIEQDNARVREIRWGPRTLDLDLIAYADAVIETEFLIVPHPRMHERAFVLAPMAELAPEWTHPTLNQTVRDLLARLES